MYRCDNEFIRENSDIREFSEFRDIMDIMERGAGEEYAPREGAIYLKYAPRGEAFYLNTASPISAAPSQRGLGTQTHKNTHKGDVCRCARCALCVRVKHTLCAEEKGE